MSFFRLSPDHTVTNKSANCVYTVLAFIVSYSKIYFALTSGYSSFSCLKPKL